MDAHEIRDRVKQSMSRARDYRSRQLGAEYTRLAVENARDWNRFLVAVKRGDYTYKGGCL